MTISSTKTSLQEQDIDDSVGLEEEILFRYEYAKFVHIRGDTLAPLLSRAKRHPFASLAYRHLFCGIIVAHSEHHRM